MRGLCCLPGCDWPALVEITKNENGARRINVPGLSTQSLSRWINENTSDNTRHDIMQKKYPVIRSTIAPIWDKLVLGKKHNFREDEYEFREVRGARIGDYVVWHRFIKDERGPETVGRFSLVIGVLKFIGYRHSEFEKTVAFIQIGESDNFNGNDKSGSDTIHRVPLREVYTLLDIGTLNRYAESVPEHLTDQEYLQLADLFPLAQRSTDESTNATLQNITTIGKTCSLHSESNGLYSKCHLRTRELSKSPVEPGTSPLTKSKVSPKETGEDEFQDEHSHQPLPPPPSPPNPPQKDLQHFGKSASKTLLETNLDQSDPQQRTSIPSQINGIYADRHEINSSTGENNTNGNPCDLINNNNEQDSIEQTRAASEELDLAATKEANSIISTFQSDKDNEGWIDVKGRRFSRLWNLKAVQRCQAALSNLSQIGPSRTTRANTSSSTGRNSKCTKLDNAPGCAERKTENVNVSSGWKALDVVGNCVALKNGYGELVSVEQRDSISRGDTIIYNSSIESNFAVGSVELLCKIRGLDDNGAVYVGVKFDKSISLWPVVIKHVPGKFSFNCEGCIGGACFFIPLEVLLENTGRDSSLFSVIKKSKESSQSVDFLHEATRNEDDVFVSLLYDWNKVYNDDIRGLRGSNNSCYADSALISMFFFTTAFDPCLNNPNKGEGEDEGVVNQAICNILKHDIVSSLRTRGSVSRKCIQKLRSALCYYDPRFANMFMDVEEFLLCLFTQILSTPPFLEFDSGAEDYVLQLFVKTDLDEPLTWKGEHPTTQELLERGELNAKLIKPPNVALILKLPVSDGVSLFPKVEVSLEISLQNLLQESSGERESDLHPMTLRAVICLEHSHFTCFVRSTDGLHWVYHDSMPGAGKKIITKLSNFSEKLLMTSSVEDDKTESCEPKLSHYVEFMERRAYMCIYEYYDTQKQETSDE